MSELLISLDDAPVDEIADLQDILQSNGVGFYMTPGGVHGHKAIWVSSNKDLDKARNLVVKYQNERSGKLKKEPNESFASFYNDKKLLLLLIVVLSNIILMMFFPYILY